MSDCLTYLIKRILRMRHVHVARENSILRKVENSDWNQLGGVSAPPCKHLLSNYAQVSTGTSSEHVGKV